MGSLIIAYDGEPDKRPLSVATINDRELLQHAAHVALDHMKARVLIVYESANGDNIGSH
jgi:hypothetical protein